MLWLALLLMYMYLIKYQIHVHQLQVQNWKILLIKSDVSAMLISDDQIPLFNQKMYIHYWR